MPWIKRNLFLVISGVVALILLGVSVFYLMKKMEADRTVNEELTAQTEVLKQLVGRSIHPNPKNIQKAKEAQKYLEQFRENTRAYFPAFDVPKELSHKDFRLLLDTTINDLRNQSQKAGVKTPDNFWFSFSAHASAVSFENRTALASRLVEVKEIIKIICDAKIHSLWGIRRVPVEMEDSSVASSDYFNSNVTTNEYAVVTPYEINFDCFSDGLEAIMEGLMNSKHAFVLRNISVEQAPEEANQQQTPGTAPVNPMTFRMPTAYPTMDRYGMASRYGMGGPGRMPGAGYGMNTPMPMPIPQAPPPPQGLTSLLDEKLLRITMSIDLVKHRPPGEAAAEAQQPAFPGMPVPPPAPVPPEAPAPDAEAPAESES